MIEISENNMMYIKGGMVGDVKDKRSGYNLLSEDFLRVNEEKDKRRLPKMEQTEFDISEDVDFE